MTKTTIYFTCISALLLLMCGCNTSDSNNHESIVNSFSMLVITPAKYNFKEISKNDQDTVNFTFKLTNQSDSTITIRDISPSCECVHINEYPDTIHPQETKMLKGFIRLTNLIGHQTKSIIIQCSNDSIAIMRISGDVIN